MLRKDKQRSAGTALISTRRGRHPRSRAAGLPVRGSGRLRVRAKGLRVGEFVKEISVEG
jgi:hypothetical protein